MSAHRFKSRLNAVELVRRTGRVRRILPTFIEADGPSAPMGSLCVIETEDANRPHIKAEVIGVHEDTIILAPLDRMDVVRAGAEVHASTIARRAPVGEMFAGRAVDAFGDPIDGGSSIWPDAHEDLEGASIAPLDRTTPSQIFHTGVRTIDGLLTIGRGQRLGIFAAAGVGKTTLQTHLARFGVADRYVLCLVGERGREIEALWSSVSSSDKAGATTLVAAASDQTAAVRTRAVEFALTLAEHWRSKGLHVLLLLDSVTRYAMALREKGLAAGEPATVRAYTPSVFAALPRLVERCGALKAGGAITCFMTVLAETDDVEDPVSETMKSLLDGHIVLSRSLAEQGIYPAIDVSRSLSRFATNLWSPSDRKSAQRAIQLLGHYEASRTLIEAGVYVRGANSETDHALDRRPFLLEFLKQEPGLSISLADTKRGLASAIGAEV